MSECTGLTQNGPLVSLFQITECQLPHLPASTSGLVSTSPPDVIPHLQCTASEDLPSTRPHAPFPEQSVVPVPGSTWVPQPGLLEPSPQVKRHIGLELCPPTRDPCCRLGPGADLFAAIWGANQWIENIFTSVTLPSK